MMNQCCTFRVNGYLFGVDVLRVREIVEYQRSTPVPLSSANVNGLINLRGEIVTAIDLRKRFSHAHECFDGGSEKRINVVVVSQDEPVCLVVNEVGEVMDVDASRIEEPPMSLNAEVQAFIDGVYKLEQELMLILNVEAAVDIVEQL
jgi:purine-binding chemotaxis protein CheW